MSTRYKIFALLALCFFQFAGAQAPPYAWVSQGNGGADIVNSNIAIDNVNHFVYVAGTFQGNYIDFGSDIHANMNPSSGSNDIFVAKYTTNGNLVWGKTFGGYATDQATGIAIDPWGNILIAGQFYSDTLWFGGLTLVNAATSQQTSVYDAFLVKLDPNGNPLWGKIGACNADAGISYVSPAGTNTLSVDNAGNAFYTGSFRGTVIFDTKTVSTVIGACLFAVKVDTSGTVQWAVQNTSLSTNLNPGSTISEAITIDNSGNCILAGWYSDDVQFGSQVFGGSDTHTSRFQAKLSNTDGSFTWITGSIWTQIDGESNYGVTSDGSGNLYFTGMIPDSLDNTNFFIEKRNSSGNVDWIIHDTAQFVLPLSIAADAAGNTYLSMAIDDTIFNFGGQVLYTHPGYLLGLVPYINTAQVVIKADNAGNVQWIKGVTPSPNSQSAIQPGGIVTGADGYVYLTGGVVDTISFDTHIINADPANSDLFVARLGGSVSAVQNIAEANTSITVFPNPSTGQFHFRFANTASKIDVRITNMLGQEIDKLEQENATDILWNPAANLGKGVYICSFNYRLASTGKEMYESRLIIVN